MTAHEIIAQYLEDAHAIHPAHLTASGLIARLTEAGFTIVDFEHSTASGG